MIFHKPPTLDEKYFPEEDKNRIQNIRSELNKKRKATVEKESKEIHWMKCPKCGNELEEINYQDVMIDRCNECKGIWLDHGELGLLVRKHLSESKIFFMKIFGF